MLSAWPRDGSTDLRAASRAASLPRGVVEGHLAGVMAAPRAESAPLSRVSRTVVDAGARLGVSLHETLRGAVVLFSALPGRPVASVATGDALAGTSLSFLWLVGELEERGPLASADAALVARAWAFGGAAALSHVYGDYAVVAVERSGRIVAATTPSSHPNAMLYTAFRDGVFSWATHPNLLLEQQAECDPDYFRRWYGALTTFERTPYRGILRVPGGHSLVLEPRATEPTLERWWKPKVATLALRSERDYQRALRETLRASVARAARGHSRVAISLSAGIDSASLAVCAKDLERAGVLEEALGVTFSTKDEPESDESPFAAEMARTLSLRHRVVTVGEPASADDELACAARMGFPTGHLLIGRFQSALAGAAAEGGATLLLNGGGAEALVAEIDDVLGSPLHGAAPVVDRLRVALDAVVHVGPRALLKAALLQQRRAADVGRSRGGMARHAWLRGGASFAQGPWLAPGPLAATDRFLTMIPTSCESHDRVHLATAKVADRAPYHDRRVLELAYSLPHWLRLRRTPALISKALARGAFPEVPWVVSKEGGGVSLNHAIARAWKAAFDMQTLRRLVTALPGSFHLVLDRERAAAAITALGDAEKLVAVEDLAATAVWAEGMRRAGWALS